MPPTRNFAANLHKNLYISPYPKTQPTKLKDNPPAVNPKPKPLATPSKKPDKIRTLGTPKNTPTTTPSLFPNSFELDNIAPKSNPDLMVDTLLKSLAKGTRKNYESAIKSYLDFCNKAHVRQDLRFPANELVLCLFVSSLSSTMAGSSVSGLLSGLKLWHTAHNLKWQGSDRLNLFIKGVAVAAPISSKRAQRDPITLEMLAALAECLDANDPRDVAIFAAALIAFWGQCRLGELLGTSSLRFDANTLPSKSSVTAGSDNDSRIIALPKTKTNRTHGQSIIILRQFSPYDPISALENHFRVNAQVKSSDHLFAFITKPHHAARCLTKEVFLNRCNEIWQARGWKRFTGHSFRIGGTTTLLRNDVAPDIVRELGRWSSDAFFRYWRDVHDIASTHAKLIPIDQSPVPAQRGCARPPSNTNRSRATGASTRQTNRALA